MDKFNFNKYGKTKDYIAVALITIVFYFICLNIDSVIGLLGSAFDFLVPFIFGFFIAFLLNPILNFFEYKILRKANINNFMKHKISAVLAFITGILLIILLFWIIVPQLLQSITVLIENSNKYISEFTSALSSNSNIDLIDSKDVAGQSGVLFNYLIAEIKKYMPQIIKLSYNVLIILFKAVIGLAAGFCIMVEKKKLKKDAVKLNYAIFSQDNADFYMLIGGAIKHIFYSFVIDRALDSFIIAIITYFTFKIYGIQYSGLITFFIAVMNMIPIFGIFLGALPGLMLILIIEPSALLFYLVYIIIIQQFDCNILTPKISGNELGISSFWILFSVMLGGTLFGIIGMFAGPPVFALIYFLISARVHTKLNEKHVAIDEKGNVNEG